MHALFRTGEPLPVPPGESAFHVRGLYYDRLLARAKKDPGGVPRLLETIEDDRVRRFIQQKFSWNDWYDVLPVMPIYDTLSKIRNQDFETAVRTASNAGAKEIIPTFFRPALRLTSPAALAGRAMNAVLYWMDFVRIDIPIFTDTESISSGAGVPLYVAPHVANLVVGFFGAFLEMRGAKVQGAYTNVVKDGVQHGLETCTIHYEFRWTSTR